MSVAGFRISTPLAYRPRGTADEKTRDGKKRNESCPITVPRKQDCPIYPSLTFSLHLPAPSMSHLVDKMKKRDHCGMEWKEGSVGEGGGEGEADDVWVAKVYYHQNQKTYTALLRCLTGTDDAH